METLSYQEGRQWLADRGLPLDLNNTYALRQSGSMAFFRLDPDASVKTQLARFMAQELFPERETVFVVLAFDMATPFEYPYIFLKYREALGTKKPLHESKFHLFDANEAEALGGAMALSLYFYWDFLVTDTALNVVIEASHDEYLQVWSGDPQTFERCEALFTDFGLERLDGPLP